MAQKGYLARAITANLLLHSLLLQILKSAYLLVPTPRLFLLILSSHCAVGSRSLFCFNVTCQLNCIHFRLSNKEFTGSQRISVSTYFDDHQLPLAAVQAPALRTPTHRFFFFFSAFPSSWNLLSSSTPGAPTSWTHPLHMTRLPTSSLTCSTHNHPTVSPRCPVSI
jgi:hypothetical protein